ncbi:helix-turn-helix domain-containing protein [Ramlibacter albus]|uniref:Helix-turn-helix domain-containing protein n=1 Tax=Ramlibacter albus TaxID=2079448 RepID=A0A923ME75_9BURK|nr:helix-turn-helix transcriptional regulator [Ramlibacter albus]MBC5767669.1 helix-turn-helix domain-containing protein [Ramlibacter albus]
MPSDARLATADELCRELGTRLREQRLALLLTQEELAQRAGVSGGAIKKLEKDGQGHVLSLVRVAMALGLAGELDSLFSLKQATSIADMERAERAKRRRAPRRRAT